MCGHPGFSLLDIFVENVLAFRFLLLISFSERTRSKTTCIAIMNSYSEMVIDKSLNALRRHRHQQGHHAAHHEGGPSLLEERLHFAPIMLRQQEIPDIFRSMQQNPSLRNAHMIQCIDMVLDILHDADGFISSSQQQEEEQEASPSRQQ